MANEQKHDKIKLFIDKENRCKRIEYQGISIPAKLIEIELSEIDPAVCILKWIGKCEITKEI